MSMYNYNTDPINKELFEYDEKQSEDHGNNKYTKERKSRR